MSQSPTDSSNAKQTSRYLAGWSALHRLIEEGSSISGRERHCGFLNTGDGPFADISAVSGLDLIDDGRAVALSDWDHDGDLDIWLTNRTSPAIRFLRNDLHAENRFVLLQLVGRQCNRDAIGARVELFPAPDDQSRITKTLRAGNGFLAQSSKWLHFGLSQADQIDRVVVHWPGGKSETFRGFEVNRRFQLVQGTGRPVLSNPKPRQVQLADTQVPPPPADAAFRLVTLPGTEPRLDYNGSGPTLIALWAGWCQPCLKELQQISTRQAELRAAGLQVLAINVDAVSSQPGFDPAKTSRFLSQIKFPFQKSYADAQSMEIFQQARKTLVGKPGPFALPTSFLVDPQRRVRVMYRGGVEVDQVLADLNLLQSSPTQLRDAATTFQGQWLGPPPRGARPR